MKVAVSSTGADLDAQVSRIFGRCPTFLFVDTDTLEFEVMPNSAVGLSGGAGVQSAQVVQRQGAEAILSGNMGPNAMAVVQSAGIPCYNAAGMTIREAIAALLAGELESMGGATVPKDYAKFGGGSANGSGGGSGRGGGMGMGRRRR